MPTFVSLTHYNSGAVVHVNMDKVFSMERMQDNYTALKPENSDLMGIAVKESPSEIMDMIRRERKS
jgi:hypothetical protein